MDDLLRKNNINEKMLCHADDIVLCSEATSWTSFKFKALRDLQNIKT